MAQRIAIYPGSFDPVTNGHLDILGRAVAIFDRVIVAVANNVQKNPLFAPHERTQLLEASIEHTGVEIDIFSGLLVDYVRQRQATHLVRGLRAVADFEYEFQLTLMNRQLEPKVDTVFLMTDQQYFYISSSLVKEVARFGGEVKQFVPSAVLTALREKFDSGT